MVLLFYLLGWWVTIPYNKQKAAKHHCGPGSPANLHRQSCLKPYDTRDMWTEWVLSLYSSQKTDHVTWKNNKNDNLDKNIVKMGAIWPNNVIVSWYLICLPFSFQKNVLKLTENTSNWHDFLFCPTYDITSGLEMPECVIDRNLTNVLLRTQQLSCIVLLIDKNVMWWMMQKCLMMSRLDGCESKQDQMVSHGER